MQNGRGESGRGRPSDTEAESIHRVADLVGRRVSRRREVGPDTLDSQVTRPRGDSAQRVPHVGRRTAARHVGVEFQMHVDADAPSPCRRVDGDDRVHVGAGDGDGCRHRRIEVAPRVDQPGEHGGRHSRPSQRDRLVDGRRTEPRRPVPEGDPRDVDGTVSEGVRLHDRHQRRACAAVHRSYVVGYRREIGLLRRERPHIAGRLLLRRDGEQGRTPS